MRTLELEVNWLFYALALALVWLCEVLGNAIGVYASLIQGGAVALLIAIVVAFAFSFMGTYFLHIDKAGISYKLLGTTQYIHADHIKKITLLNLGLVNIPVVHLDDGRKIRFFCWKMTQSELSRVGNLVNAG
ncbi:hypothetical protein [Pseudoalteromonas piscicida]|uniref:PH domain-containing protein n=1 Tax=Pseudoalteromonas piscicida TaxID=43662 RepID=A0A2A5JMT6_PSEO7|nr:hypothetical protein [Pseudoalteromonas piscicida]PCK30762.1 hypothetical protein CEX98_15945 [Pseudoalteromonas piscicida]